LGRVLVQQTGSNSGVGKSLDAVAVRFAPKYCVRCLKKMCI
jgi:hypothetical protein